MIFGRPSGRRRMPAVTIAVPPPPPMPMMPAMSPRLSMKRAKASVIAATATPRSSPPSTAAGRRRGDEPATSDAVDVDMHGRPARADVDAQHLDAGGGDRIGQKGELVALGVRRAHHVDALAHHPPRPTSQLRRCGSVVAAAHRERGHCIFLRRAYRIDMLVSRQEIRDRCGEQSAVRARAPAG